MSLQVSIRLKLNKIVNNITVKYNTFEKATYDQFLATSIALRSKDDFEAEEYIGAITGSGSLNEHFKKLYLEAKKLNKEQLVAIMKNSMYPILKIDKQNKYDYYPELDVSVFRREQYTGNFGKYPDLIEYLYIQEEVIECKVDEYKQFDKPEPYSVLFDNNKITVKIADKYTKIDKTTFEELFINELENIKKYKGTIHSGVDGDNWHTLTNGVLNSIFQNNNYYYDVNGDHLQIRSDNIKKTIVSQIAGLYIYREEIISYKNNKDICLQVLQVLEDNDTLYTFKTGSILLLLSNVDSTAAQKYINNLLLKNDSKDLSLLGLDLLMKGIMKGWNNEALNSFIKYADNQQLNKVYQANNNLHYDIKQLLVIDREHLSTEHRYIVEKYNADRQLKIDTISNIIGAVTTSGIRERVKDLKADDDTKRFTKLANKLIGHSEDINKTETNEDLELWLKNAIELNNLATKLEKQLDKKEK